MEKHRKRYKLKHRDGRVWKIEITGNSFAIESFTKTSLTGEDKSFPDEKACRKEAKQQVKIQLQQGFKEIKAKQVDKKIRPKTPKALKAILENLEIQKKKSIKISQFIELRNFELSTDPVISRFPEDDQLIWELLDSDAKRKLKSDFIPFIKDNSNDLEAMMVFGIFSSEKIIGFSCLLWWVLYRLASQEALRFAGSFCSSIFTDQPHCKPGRPAQLLTSASRTGLGTC
jgi:hypothetical protein